MLMFITYLCLLVLGYFSMVVWLFSLSVCLSLGVF